MNHTENNFDLITGENTPKVLRNTSLKNSKKYVWHDNGSSFRVYLFRRII